MKTKVTIQEAEIKYLYLMQGLGIREVGIALATSPATIYRRLVALSIPRRKRGGGVITTQGRFVRTPEYCLKLSAAAKGTVFSEERKRHISKAKSGIALTNKHREALSYSHMGKTGEQSFWFGKHRTSETKAKIRSKLCGSQSPLWRGGFSRKYSNEFNSELRELIRQRDNFTCQLCGVPQQECLNPLCVHHIDYNKYNPMPHNLISLCKSCHSRVNFNREYWQTILAQKMEERYEILR